ncbi:MAG: M20 family metallopeptidase [Pseudomonadota bacterium]
MNRDAAIAWTADYFAMGHFEADLSRRVAIPTESQHPRGLPHCRAYLSEEMAGTLGALGFATRIIENPVEGIGPVMIAHRDEGADLTVLGYGHGDVILGQDERWTKGNGPWAAARDGDRLYGRGTADNKGQHSINIAALQAAIETRGKLGFNAKILIETAEENGSVGLHQIVEADRDAFAADVFIASDGPRVRADRPTLSLGARGGMNFDLICDLREGAHHSGNWGGALADPAMILSHALASISGPTGEILVPEMLPPPMTNAVRAALADIEIDGGPDGPVIDPGWGAPGLTTAERVYGWNSFAVLALGSGDIAAPVNAIQPKARAHCQLRFVAGTDTSKVLPGLRAHLDAAGFDMVEIRPPDGRDPIRFDASRTEPDHPWVARVLASVEETIGTRPAIIPQMGGSICNDVFTDILGLPAIWLPHSYTGCSQHAPDEHLLLPVAENALAIMAGLYWDLGEAAQTAL